MDVLARTTNRRLFHRRGCVLGEKPFDTYSHHFMLSTFEIAVNIYECKAQPFIHSTDGRSIPRPFLSPSGHSCLPSPVKDGDHQMAPLSLPQIDARTDLANRI
jgi:hypothetical protein